MKLRLNLELQATKNLQALTLGKPHIHLGDCPPSCTQADFKLTENLNKLQNSLMQQSEKQNSWREATRTQLQLGLLRFLKRAHSHGPHFAV